MSSEAPYWIELSKALLTPTVALIAVVVAVFQWRTAHFKTVLDLFSKRLSAYNELREALYPIIAAGYPHDEHWYKFSRAQESAKFLFGKEVSAYIQSLREIMADMQMHTSMIPASTQKEKQDHLAARRDLFKEFVKFPQKLDLAVAPYMMMDQRRGRFFG